MSMENKSQCVKNVEVVKYVSIAKEKTYVKNAVVFQYAFTTNLNIIVQIVMVLQYVHQEKNNTKYWM